jgi:TP901 family phage tail tape measure protein
VADSIGTAFVDVAFDPKQIQGQLGGMSGKVEGAFGKFGGKWGIAAASGFGAAIAGAVVAGKYLYKIGAQFDDMADTIRVSTGKTGKQLDVLVETAKKVGTDVPTSFEDAGKAVATLSTRLGVTGKPLRTLSDQMLELARLSGSDLPTALNSVTRMLGDAGLKGADASKGIDELWRASQATQVPVTRLADLLTKFGGPMRQLGFSFEEQAALLGKFEKEGVNTELVMGSMRIALGKFAKEGKEPVKALRETLTAIHDTGSQAEANKKAIELFGARAGPDMAAAIREGRFSIDDLVKTIKGGRETVLQAGKDTSDFSEQWQIFQNKVAVAVAPAAEALFTAVGDGMKYVNENAGPLIQRLTQELGPAIKDLGPMFDDLVAIAKALTPVWQAFADAAVAHVRRIVDTFKGVLEVVEGVVKIVRGILTGDWSMAWDGAKKVVTGFVDIVKAQLEFAKSILDIYKGLLGAGAHAVGDAIKNGVMAGVDAITGLVKGAFNALSSAVRGALQTVSSTVTSVFNTIVSTVSSAGSRLVQGFSNAIRGAVGAVTSAVGAVKSAVMNAFSSAATWVVNFGRALVQGFVQGISGAVGAVTAGANAVKGAVVGAFSGAASWLVQAGVQVAEGFASGIASAVGSVVSAAKHMAGSAIGAVKDAIIPGSPSKVTYELGVDTAEGFAQGIKESTPKATKAAYEMAAKSVEAAEGPLKAATDKLSSYLEQAFGAKQSAEQTPAEKRLAAVTAAHDEAARQQALADAKQQQAAATNDQERLAADQAFADAQYAIQVAALQKQADQEKQAQEGRQFVRQQQFDDALKRLQTYLGSAEATAEGSRKRINAFAKQFGIDMSSMGELLGTSFEKGIRKATAGVVDAAKDLADAVKKAMKSGVDVVSGAAGKAGGKSVPGPAPPASASAGLRAAAPLGSAPAGGTLYGTRSPFDAFTRTLSSIAAGPADTQPAATVVRVYIGDEELRGIVRTEVGYIDDATARIVLAGAR